MKKVLEADMFGLSFVVLNFPGTDDPFRVYDGSRPNELIHLKSFESFQEAWEFVGYKLYS